MAERLNSLNKKLQSEQIYLYILQMLKAGLMSDSLSDKKRVKVDKEYLSKTAV